MSSKTIPVPPGIYVPVPTFFDGSSFTGHTPPLDIRTQCKHAIYLAKAGITGIVLLGSTGEAVSLSSTERNEILHQVKEALRAVGFSDYPLIAGTASYNLRETIQQCIDARTAGMRAVMCLAPGFFAGQTTSDGLARWYEAVAAESPLPIMIYNYPAVTNNLVLRPALYARLAAHPNILGAKLSHGDISLLAQITNGPSPHTKPDVFRVFTGLGQQLVPVLAVNGAGAIDGLAGVFPRVILRLYEIYIQSANSEAEHSADLKAIMGELQGDVSRAEELVVKWGTVGIKEAIARELGLGSPGATRLPLVGGLPEGSLAEFDEALSKLRRMEEMLTQHHVNVERKEGQLSYEH